MNGLQYFDRLLDEEVLNTNGKLTAGRLILLCENQATENGISVSRGDFLLPGSDGKVRLSMSDNQEVVIENYSYDQFPDKNELDNLMAIGRRLQKLGEDGASWDDWIKVPPLIINNADKLRLMQFDQVIIKYIWHLQWVCEHPLTQLTINIERMPVWQARRIPTKAYEHLSAHTEDWEYPKQRSVVPRRILSTIPEEQFDFYENRLAARLLSEVYKYLSNRISEIQRIGEIKLELELGTHWRRGRVYSLLGDAFNLEDIQKNASFIKKPLEMLYGLTLGMFDKQLFQAIPSQSRDQVPPIVRSTNILTNDRHYRYVNILWREYLKHHHDRPKSNIQLQLELHELCKNFDLYCMLLVCRGLDQLGFSPEEHNPLERGKKVRLANQTLSIEVEWEKDGCIILFYEQELLLRIVPLIASLTNSTDQDIVFSQLNDVISPWILAKKTDVKKKRRGSEKRIARTIVMYPGSSKERQKLPIYIQRLANTPGNDLQFPLDIGFIPISTYELGSVERVARALRWSITGKNILCYPPEISVSGRIKKELLQEIEWIKSGNGSMVAKLLRRPYEREYSKHLEAFRGLHGELTRLGSKAQQDIQWLDQYWNQLQKEFLYLDSLCTCPLCKKEVRIGEFHVFEDETFYCECREPSCQVTWGKRFCNSCKQPYPFIDFMKLDYPLEINYSDWVDRQFGMDILAVYCPKVPHTFICPSCGQCGQNNLQDNEFCKNCRSFRAMVFMEGEK